MSVEILDYDYAGDVLVMYQGERYVMPMEQDWLWLNGHTTKCGEIKTDYDRLDAILIDMWEEYAENNFIFPIGD